MARVPVGRCRAAAGRRSTRQRIASILPMSQMAGATAQRTAEPRSQDLSGSTQSLKQSSGPERPPSGLAGCRHSRADSFRAGDPAGRNSETATLRRSQASRAPTSLLAGRRGRTPTEPLDWGR